MLGVTAQPQQERETAVNATLSCPGALGQSLPAAARLAGFRQELYWCLGPLVVGAAAARGPPALPAPPGPRPARGHDPRPGPRRIPRCPPGRRHPGQRRENHPPRPRPTPGLQEQAQREDAKHGYGQLWEPARGGRARYGLPFSGAVSGDRQPTAVPAGGRGARRSGGRGGRGPPAGRLTSRSRAQAATGDDR